MDLFTRAQQAEADEVLIQLHPSPIRRNLGLVSLALLSALALRHGLWNETGEGLKLLPLIVGLMGLYVLFHFAKSSTVGLELTPTELREIGGRRVIAVADIGSVEREAFGVIKPTNGFVIVNKGSYPSAISPGIWWRHGRRIGIGGLTPAGEGKAMAELLQEMVKHRDQGSWSQAD